MWTTLPGSTDSFTKEIKLSGRSVPDPPHAGPNPKYFAYERGVTYYNLVPDRFTGLNAITVPGTLRDILVLLAVVLEQQTELNPTDIMTDTGAYTALACSGYWAKR